MEPQEVGCFSLVSGEVLFNDRRNLKSYKEPDDKQNVQFDLNKGYPEKFKDWDPDDTACDLDHTLKWIKEAERENPNILSDVKFVTKRGILTKVMCKPRSRDKKMYMRVTKFQDTWYISKAPYGKYGEQRSEEQRSEEQRREEQRSEEQLREKQRRELEAKKYYWGHKFEQYMTGWAESRDEKPNKLDLNVEAFYTVMTSKLYPYSLLYSAEVDAAEKTERGAAENTGSYMEFKTIEIPQKTANKEAYDMHVGHKVDNQLQWCWLQPYLAGVKKIVFGIRRDDKGVVTDFREREITDRMLNVYKSDWEVYLNSCGKFLKDIESNATEDNARVVYLFERWQHGMAYGMAYEGRYEGPEHTFLPEWYTGLKAE